jgi:hypothetical protein
MTHQIQRLRCTHKAARHLCLCPTLMPARTSGLTSILTVVMIFTGVAESAARSDSASPRLVEVTTESLVLQGKVVEVTASQASLLDRFGRLEKIQTGTLKSCRVISDQYRPATAAEFREQLRREFPANFEVTVSAQYIVCGPKGRTEDYMTIFQDIYRTVERYYRVHGFRVSAPETPLTAVIFSAQQDFSEYCRKDLVPWSPGLKGYYSLRSNRIIMFDHREVQNTGVTEPGPTDDVPLQEFRTTTALARLAVSDSTAGTIIHEATHQIGYNVGIHSRLSVTPTWIVEGLATVLEAPGMRHSALRTGQQSRLNTERHEWFMDRYSINRQPGDLAAMIASDDAFGRASLDAYSHAWAFTFFLTENPSRAQQFTEYLRMIAQKKNTTASSASERLKDFQQFFGDISKLEVEFIRFMDRMPRSSTVQASAGNGQ